MTDVNTALLHLFPTGRPGIDWKVEDHSDGQGPRIVAWNLQAAQPSVAALQAVEGPAIARRSTLAAIAAIEATITQRRIREHLRGTDGGWLVARDDEIAALRAQL
jgi:hypothetical protein